MNSIEPRQLRSRDDGEELPFGGLNKTSSLSLSRKSEIRSFCGLNNSP